MAAISKCRSRMYRGVWYEKSGGGVRKGSEWWCDNERMTVLEKR